MSGQGGTPPGGTPPGVASDQSMEDILASIRRILNEDETPPASDTPAGAADPEPVGKPAGPEPLLLTEDMMVSLPEEPAPTPEVAAAPPAPEVAAAPPPASEPEPPAEPVPEPEPEREPEAPPAAAPAASPESLLAPAVAAAAAASVGQLLRAVSTERSAAVHRGGPTIEDVVREELRPLLKDWLDQHLPALVERLVRAEIERVVGRALS